MIALGWVLFDYSVKVHTHSLLYSGCWSQNLTVNNWITVWVNTLQWPSMEPLGHKPKWQRYTQAPRLMWKWSVWNYKSLFVKIMFSRLTIFICPIYLHFHFPKSLNPVSVTSARLYKEYVTCWYICSFLGKAIHCLLEADWSTRRDQTGFKHQVVEPLNAC